jgi:hypothetical protein
VCCANMELHAAKVALLVLLYSMQMVYAAITNSSCFAGQ